MWWERNEREPGPTFYPAIIRFLGHEPWPEPRTLAEALRVERLRRGWAARTAAERIGVDEGTWARWEHGEWRPTRLTLPAIDQFLGCSASSVFPNNTR